MNYVVSRVVRNVRQIIINRLADKFESSGIEYTCSAVVRHFALDHLPAEVKKLSLEYRRHKAMRVSLIPRDVADEVHRRYLARVNG